MKIGIPKEIKTDEYRVGATPLNVLELIKEKHELFVQRGAGLGSGFSDEEYENAGATLVNSAAELYGSATLIVKVKEPQSTEYEFLNETHTLFCYLHLAPTKELTSLLVDKKVCTIAYETVSQHGELPLLSPMSEIAGKMSPIVGAYHLSRYQGGNGLLISGADGVDGANVLIIGAGNAGYNAAKVAIGMGANVTVINRTMPRLEKLKSSLPQAKIELLTQSTLEGLLKEADIVIGSVLIHGGAAAPKLINRDTLRSMKDGSIIVDITIDQGGIIETSRPTTHTKPVYKEENVLHYCVANMPGAYPKTSTVALTNATFEFVKELADTGIVNTIKNNNAIALGVNTFAGNITNEAVAKIHGFEFKNIESAVASTDLC